MVSLWLVTQPYCLQGAIDKVGEPKGVFLGLHHHFLCLADAGLRLAGPEDGQAGRPSEAAEQTVLSAAVSRDPEGERELCARGMAALYHAHAAAIGMSSAVGLPFKYNPESLHL